MLAPNHVSAPATTHTSSMPAKLGTARLTSDGWTKIEAPTIVPTTIAVAWVRPIDRASFVTVRECYLSQVRFERGMSVAVVVVLTLACGGNKPSPTAPSAADVSTYQSSHFTFRYTALDAASVAQTAALVEAEHARVLADLAVTDMPPVSVTLYT